MSQHDSLIPANSIMVYTGAEFLGDGFVKTGFIRGLRAAYPDAHITWVAGITHSVYTSTLKPFVSQYLDEIIDCANVGTSWKQIFTKPMEGRRFDLVIDTQKSVRKTLVVRSIRHRYFISPCLNWRLSYRLPPTGRPPKRVNIYRHFDLLLAAVTGRQDNEKTPIRLPDAFTRAADAALAGPGPFIGQVPGAGTRNRCWPLDRHMELARRILAGGAQPVIILGPQETDWIAPFRKAVPDALYPLQDERVPDDIRTSPLFTFAVARKLSRAVTGDCGTGHILATAETPLISLFGPSLPDKWAQGGAKPTVIDARDFGRPEMDAIPVDVVAKTLGV
ncbi:MAG: glycosyltransferase family 9 protein [Pseudomonadota bacterium]|nr:glycosyltransferase family 9 protein [Pseudomonadota bacterium]